MAHTLIIFMCSLSAILLTRIRHYLLLPLGRCEDLTCNWVLIIPSNNFKWRQIITAWITVSNACCTLHNAQTHTHTHAHTQLIHLFNSCVCAVEYECLNYDIEIQINKKIENALILRNKWIKRPRRRENCEYCARKPYEWVASFFNFSSLLLTWMCSWYWLMYFILKWSPFVWSALE